VPGAANYNVSTALAGDVAHLLLSQATLYTPAVEVGDTTLYTDSATAAENYGADTANPAQASIATVLVPASDATISSNVDFSVIFVLNKRLPQGLIEQFFGLGNQLYGTASIATPGSPVAVPTFDYVVGPASATADHIAAFDGVTGDLIKDGGIATTALVQTSRTLTASTGLTGGGDLSANRSFAVAYGTSASTATEGNDGRVGALKTATTNVSFAAATAPTAGMVPRILTTTTGEFAFPGQGQVLTADSANLSTGALADVAGFAWALKAGVTYRFEFDLTFEKATNTGTYAVSVNYSAGITTLRQTANLQGSSSNMSNIGVVRNTANNTALTSAASLNAATSSSIATLRGDITPSADGTLHLAARTSTADSVIKAGSSGRVDAALLV
jgi:hypothetical protein